MNCDILKAKRLKRKYQRAWRSENSASNRSQYRAGINHYNFMLERSKCNHYSNIVAENQGNPKALWNCFKKILHRSSVAVLPDCTNKTDLVNTFCKFFNDKILKIRSTSSDTSKQAQVLLLSGKIRHPGESVTVLNVLHYKLSSYNYIYIAWCQRQFIHLNVNIVCL